MIGLATWLMALASPIGPGVPGDMPAPCAQRSIRGIYVTPADYPEDALVAGDSATVRLAIDVSAAGCPIACRVTSSSGLASMDAQSCRIYMERGRFRPTLDRDYHAIETTLVRTIRWSQR